MDKRAFKTTVYTELSKVVKAMANPVRLEIIDLLAQGPFTVEQLATSIDQSVANTSQHLQNLKNAALVQVNKQGNFVLYTLSSKSVYQTWLSLRTLGMEFNAEIAKTIGDFRQEVNATVHGIKAENLSEMLEREEVLLLDVRPEEEFHRGHIEHALSIPISRLAESLENLTKKKTLVVYCRGPFCVYADQAVALLISKGFKAIRLEEGYGEWALLGLPTRQTED